MATTSSTGAKRKLEAQPKLKLYYFNIKGKGEPIRLLCAYAGLELEDYRLKSYAEFLELKESMAFGQVPLLEVTTTTTDDDNGTTTKHQLVQMAAILRYLAKLAGLYCIQKTTIICWPPRSTPPWIKTRMPLRE